MVLTLVVSALIAITIWQYAPRWFDRPPAPTPVPAPFAGTDANGWAQGADGIVAPDDNPIFIPVRQALVLSRVDPKAVSERDPAAFLAMLSPGSRANYERTLLSVTTQIRPGTVLMPDGVRARGSMSEAVDNQGRPVVMTDYTFAYALRPDNLHEAADVVYVRARVDFRPSEQGLAILAATSSAEAPIGGNK